MKQKHGKCEGGVHVDQSNSAMKASTWSWWGGGGGGGVRKNTNCMRKMYDCACANGVWCMVCSQQFTVCLAGPKQGGTIF